MRIKVFSKRFYWSNHIKSFAKEAKSDYRAVNVKEKKNVPIVKHKKMKEALVWYYLQGEVLKKPFKMACVS